MHIIVDMSSVEVEEIERAFGERIRALRIAAGHSQQELAQRSNLSRSAIHSLETGSGTSLSTIVRVLLVLERTEWLESLEAPAPEFNPFEVLEQARSEKLPGPPRVKRKTKRAP